MQGARAASRYASSLNVVTNSNIMPTMDKKDTTKKSLEEQDKKKEPATTAINSNLLNNKKEIKELTQNAPAAKRISTKEVYKVKEALNSKK
jgi:hypothetical protein